MNRYDVRITRQAEDQINDIAYHIAVILHDPDAAEGLVDDLHETIDSLGYNPERKFLVDEEPWHSEGVRKIKVKNYMMYFLIDAENAAVHITGVCYAGRDQKKFLGKMKME